MPETTTETAPPADTQATQPTETKPVEEAKPAPPPAPKTATATLAATAKSKVTGTITFKEADGGLEVTANIENLTPGDHAWHVHEKGDCSGADGMTTGGHFNPDGKPHGQHGAGAHHVGDLPALMADATGVARFSFESSSITVAGGTSDVVGKGLIVHKDPDDYRTQPTGNAGARIACAVITRT